MSSGVDEEASAPTSLVKHLCTRLLADLNGSVNAPEEDEGPAEAPDLVALLVTRLNLLEREAQGLRLELAAAQQDVASARSQVAEMQAFLSDYGLVFVGGAAEDLTRRLSGGGTPATTEGAGAPPPQPADCGTGLPCSFSELAQRVEELNAAVEAEGGAGAAGWARQHVQLMVFADGLQLGAHPGRAYGDTTAAAILSDLLDGFMPSVMRLSHPKGAPLELVDRRGLTMAQAAAGASSGSKVVSFEQLMTQPPAALHIDKESLLAKLPKTVIRNGQLVDVRGSVASFMQGPADSAAAGGGVQLIPAWSSAGQPSQGGQQPASSEPQTTLQVKSADGRQTFVLKLATSSTIGDVRRCLDAHLGRAGAGSCEGAAPAAAATASAGSDTSGPACYQLRAAFPTRVFTDDSVTLEAAGLAPTAMLFMQVVVAAAAEEVAA